MGESLKEVSGKKQSLEDSVDALNEELAQLRAQEQLYLSQVGEAKEEVSNSFHELEKIWELG